LSRRADACNLVGELGTAIGIVDAGVPPEEFLDRCDVARDIRTISSRPVEADAIREPALAFAAKARRPGDCKPEETAA
jgi:hypothetical protein